MPLLAEDSLPALFDDVIAGKVRLVAWGAVDNAALFQWSCPLPLAYYVDTEWRRWGQEFCGAPIRSPSVLQDEDPATTVVVVHYFMLATVQDLYDFLERVGPFRYFVPAPIDIASPSAGVAPTDEGALGAVVAVDPVRSDKAALARAILANRGSESHWQRATRLLAQRRRLLAETDTAPRGQDAVFFVECLHLGGAERQLSNLALGMAQQGWRTTLAVTRPEPPEAAHYVEFLRSVSVDYRLVTLPEAPEPGDVVSYLLKRVEPDVALVLWHMPPHLLPVILTMYLYLRDVRPQLVVCHLDRPNIIGAMAAALAGVPAILMSGRNVNPTHFPHFYTGQTQAMWDVYQVLLHGGGARLSANSRIGAESYARWLGMDVDAVPVVRNCVAAEALAEIPARAAEGVRALLNIPDDAPMVLGVFRLAPEKRPLLFIEVVARLRRAVPNVHAVICGTGALEGECRRRAEQLGIAGAVAFMQAVQNVAAVMRAGTLLLHVSEFEGTPNALLEAQAQGLPVVCTRTGGSEEALAPELADYALDPDDVDGLVGSCLRLLSDASLRDALGDRARAHVLEHHSLAALVRNTLAVALAP
ncbi:MAG TPA: glycosyltransferase [Magnetospirillum sp.]|nr:glycosyltransferase [Magnetospirillum sp.]